MEIHQQHANGNALLKALIIDDFDLTRDLLRIILRNQQYEVVGEARTGMEGIALALKSRPDIILLDLYMPDMDSRETLKLMKQILPTTDILMITINYRTSTIETITSLGQNGYSFNSLNSETVINSILQPRDRSASRNAAIISMPI